MAVDMKNYFNKNSGNDAPKKDDNQDNQKPNGEFKPPKMPDFLKNFNMGWLYGAIGVVLVLVLFRPFIIINSGETGILVTLGKYQNVPLNPGFHLYLPIMQRVIVVDTRVRIMNYSNEEIGGGKGGVTRMPPIGVLDSRGLPVEVELTVQYNLLPDKAAEAVATLGLNWEEKTISPMTRDVVRSVVGNFKAEELPTKRDEIAQLITHGMQKAVSQIQGQPIRLDSMQLRGIVLPEKVKEQIERVQIANQEAERAKYEVEKAKFEAQKEAEVARGQADARLIQAKGQAESNDLISKSLTPNLIRLKQIEAQAKFNDALRENKDAKVFLTPNGAMPTVWMNMNSAEEKTAATSGGDKK
jgi:regulator of protease activity HflC (stomatin/prohibitin superfamily)